MHHFLQRPPSPPAPVYSVSSLSFILTSWNIFLHFTWGGGMRAMLCSSLLRNLPYAWHTTHVSLLYLGHLFAHHLPTRMVYFVFLIHLALDGRHMSVCLPAHRLSHPAILHLFSFICFSQVPVAKRSFLVLGSFLSCFMVVSATNSAIVWSFQPTCLSC